MKKIKKLTTASLKISILALLFFVTAGASLVDNIRSINQHQEYLPGDNSLAFRNSQDTISSTPIPSPGPRNRRGTNSIPNLIESAPRNRQGAISIEPNPSPAPRNNGQDTISSTPIPSPAPRNRQGAISIAPLPSP